MEVLWLKNKLLCSLAVPSLGIYQKIVQLWYKKMSIISMFMVELVMVAKKWSPPMCSPVGQRTLHVHSVTIRPQIGKYFYWPQHGRT